MRLHTLRSQAWSRVSEVFRDGSADVDFSDAVEPFDRAVELDGVRYLIDHVTSSDCAPAESDRWLAPRLHASLRLTPREASDQRLWAYLGVVAAPDYVRWRFPATGTSLTPKERFVGRDDKQALSRLWWGAELTRNGDDYSPTADAFAMQDIPNQWQRLDAFHNRPLALAAVRFLSRFRDGSPASHDQVVQLSRAFNLVLTAAVLDAVAQDPGTPAAVWEEWLAGDSDETLWLEELPEGPNDDPVPEERIGAMYEFVAGIADDIHLTEVKRDRGSSDG